MALSAHAANTGQHGRLWRQENDMSTSDLIGIAGVAIFFLLIWATANWESPTPLQRRLRPLALALFAGMVALFVYAVFGTPSPSCHSAGRGVDLGDC